MKVVSFPTHKITITERQVRPLGDIDSLVASIKDIGLLHPIVVNTGGKLKVGYRRLIAFRRMGRHAIPAHVTDDLDDILRALRAERDENIQRQDLPPSLLVERARELHEAEKRRATERQAHGETAPGRNASGKLPEAFEAGTTRDKVAAAFGISGKTYEKARQVMDAAQDDPEIFGDLPEIMDSSSIHRAHRELIKRKRKDPPPLPEGKYRIFYADPPWQYSNAGIIGPTDNYGHVHRHYPSMPIKELCDMGKRIKEMTGPNAVLFLWATAPLLEDSFKVIEAWGFVYKTNIVWDKIKHNFGHYVSVRHEHLLICTRGSCTPDTGKLHDSVQSIERSRTHSEKPEEFRAIIDRLYTYGKRIELFARAPTSNWDTWGNELGQYKAS